MTVEAAVATAVDGGIGQSPGRPDGTLKVKGEYAFSSDLWHEDMLWGATLRSPHPHARIVRLDVSRALAQPGVAQQFAQEGALPLRLGPQEFRQLAP